MRKAVTQYIVALLVLGVLWQAGSVWLGSFILPRPLEVIQLLGEHLGDGEFWLHVTASLRRVVLALLLAWCVAFPAGLVMGYGKRLDAVLSPFVFLTYPLPKIVLLPLFLTLFGLGDLPRILLIALTVGYQILVVTRSAAQGVDWRYIESFRSLHGSPLQLVRHVLIPAVLPDAITALRVASGTAVAVLFMAESFATQEGLGFLIMDAWGRSDQPEMFAGIVAMSLLGVMLYEACNWLERHCCRWRRQ